jgi:hypothetical protein
MLRRFWRYAEKVFDLSVLMGRLRDTRRIPLFSTEQIWQTAAVLLATGRGSLHAIEADRHSPEHRYSKRGTGPPSDDTLGRVFELLDPEPQRQMLVSIVQRLNRNKALPAQWNLRHAAVDGHEFFSQ